MQSVSPWHLIIKYVRGKTLLVENSHVMLSDRSIAQLTIGYPNMSNGATRFLHSLAIKIILIFVLICLFIYLFIDSMYPLSETILSLLRVLTNYFFYIFNLIIYLWLKFKISLINLNQFFYLMILMWFISNGFKISLIIKSIYVWSIKQKIKYPKN